MEITKSMILNKARGNQDNKLTTQNRSRLCYDKHYDKQNLLRYHWQNCIL